MDFFAGYNLHPNDGMYLISGQVEGTLLNTVAIRTSGTRAYSTSLQQFNGITSTLISQTQINGINLSETTSNLDSMFSFIGRVGLFAKPTILVYGLIGATEGNFVNINTSANTNITNNITNSRGQWHLGLNTGAGLEYKLTNHWSLLGEYRYLHFQFNSNGSIDTNSTNVTQNGNVIIRGRNNLSNSQLTHANFNFSAGQVGVVYRI